MQTKKSTLCNSTGWNFNFHNQGQYSQASFFSPYRAPEAPGAEIPEKWGKITKFPSPVQPPKMGKNYRKITKNTPKIDFFCNFSVIFPHFRGLDRGGEFCNFSRGLPGLCKGKNNSQGNILKLVSVCSPMLTLQMLQTFLTS